MPFQQAIIRLLHWELQNLFNLSAKEARPSNKWEKCAGKEMQLSKQFLI